jgi:hypothetical protein
MTKLCQFENCKNRATYGTNSNPVRCVTHKEVNMKASCGLCKCGKYAIYNFIGKRPAFCISCREEGMINVKDKKCKCGNGLKIYNYEGLKAEFCSSCKEEKMVNVIHKKCNCGKSFPNYNYVNLGAKYCVECKLDGMINVKETKCFCNKKRPCFNFDGLKPLYCLECKLDGMINVNNKKCVCGSTYLIYNYEGLTPAFCKNCKKDNMVDLRKKCYCGKSIPYFNIQGLKPEYCSECKTSNMVNLLIKKCFCNKSHPSFNFKGMNPEYCSNCKFEGMINVHSKKCLNCPLQSSFNYKNETEPLYCSHCKQEGMINIKQKACKAENCMTIGNKNYKGYCANCFQHLFPTDPLTFQIRSKTKEIAVRDFINSRFEGFQHDKPLWYNETVCDCTSKRRIDHRKLINDTLLCIETDENQHKSYSKEDEIARYNDLFMAFGGKFIFIRFNPDKYKDKNGKSCNPMLVNRLPVLEAEINKQIKRIENSEHTELLEVIELYYDKST